MYPLTATVATGLLGGFSAGTTNVMVAILIIYFLAMEIDRREMVPAMNLCFLVGKMSQIVVFAVAGLIDVRLLLMTTPLAAFAIGALWLGQRVSSKIPQQRYRRILRWVLALLAAVLIIQFFGFAPGGWLDGPLLRLSPPGLVNLAVSCESNWELIS